MAKRTMHRFAKIDVQRVQTATGLDWYQLVTLAVNFGSQYGPEVLVIITAVVSTIKGPNSATSLVALVRQYGPDVEQMAEEIAKMFGITLPPAPTTAG